MLLYSISIFSNSQHHTLQNAKMLIRYFHTKSIIHSKKQKIETNEIHPPISPNHNHNPYKSKINFRKTSRENNSLSRSPPLDLNERERERVVFSRDTIITVDREGLVARGFDGIRGPAFEKSRVAE